MPMKPWRVLNSTALLDRWPWLRVWQDRVRLPNGLEIADFYRIEMPEWVQIFALTAEGRVPMVEHYKHGGGMTSLELPAGYIEPNEAPEQAARRELHEETGVEAAEWRYLGRYFLDGNRGCGASHIFLARRARQVSAPHLDAGEIMQLRWLTLAEVRAAWLGGHIRNLGILAGVGLALGALEADHAANTRGSSG